MQRREPAFCRTRTQHLPGRYRLHQALQHDAAEVPAVEQAADLPPRGRIDHHLSRSREALQPGRPVRCLANRRLLARIPRADWLTDHHKAGGDANADLERLATHLCFTDRGSNSETGTHSAFGVSLMGFRPAEVDQHAVTDIAGNEAIELLDGGSDTGLVAADDVAQVLGIE